MLQLLLSYKVKVEKKVIKPHGIDVLHGGKTAEVINQYFKKGNQIYIEGSLESRSYEIKMEKKDS